jgi:hypothetical protein
MDWATLMNRPAAYIDATRLAACFDGGVSVGLCGRLRDASRLQDRLSAMISDFYGLAAPVGMESVSPVDQKVALLAAEQTNSLIHRAGAVYWANAISNVVRAEAVRRLRDRLGESLYSFALANRHLSAPQRKLDLVDGADVQIAEDGVRCLAAWCQSQAEAIGGRVRLKRPSSPALEEATQSPFSDVGPAIIRCAVV